MLYPAHNETSVKPQISSTAIQHQLLTCITTNNHSKKLYDGSASCCGYLTLSMNSLCLTTLISPYSFIDANICCPQILLTKMLFNIVHSLLDGSTVMWVVFLNSCWGSSRHCQKITLCHTRHIFHVQRRRSCLNVTSLNQLLNEKCHVVELP